MNKNDIKYIETMLKNMRFDFLSLIASKKNRQLIQEKTGVSQCNLLNYSSGLKNISDNKIIEIYKKIL